MSANNVSMVKDWADAYKSYKETGIELSSPSETLIRLLKGNYLTGKALNVSGKSILDVGFGNGNNLALYASLGMKIYGTEIHDDICNQVLETTLRAGIKADLRVGTNRDIPFEDHSFDYLISWNVLHYEGNESRIKEAIKEYARVLKPGGRIILSTGGPENRILRDGTAYCTTLGNHLYEISRADDFRIGQVHFFFDSSNYLEYYFTPFFGEIQTGRLQDNLFREKIDWLLFTGIKK